MESELLQSSRYIDQSTMTKFSIPVEMKKYIKTSTFISEIVSSTCKHVTQRQRYIGGQSRDSAVDFVWEANLFDSKSKIRPLQDYKVVHQGFPSSNTQ